MTNRRLLVCPCGCFKFHVLWSIPVCAYCGTVMPHRIPRDCIQDHADVIPVSPSGRKRAKPCGGSADVAIRSSDVGEDTRQDCKKEVLME